MKTQLIAALLIALSVGAAAPAFASGYGPAPDYKPSAGAPASPRGESVQTLSAGCAGASSLDAYGGVAPGRSESGRPAAIAPHDSLFAHH